MCKRFSIDYYGRGRRGRQPEASCFHHSWGGNSNTAKQNRREGEINPLSRFLLYAILKKSSCTILIKRLLEKRLKWDFHSTDAFTTNSDYKLRTPYSTQHFCTKLQYFPNKTSNPSSKPVFMTLYLNSEMFCYRVFIEKCVWNSLLSDFYYWVTVFFENSPDFWLKRHLPIPLKILRNKLIFDGNFARALYAWAVFLRLLCHIISFKPKEMNLFRSS